MYPKVSIIILNWNGWKDTIECLESLYQINYPNYNVIVVDNGSEDDSIEKIKEYTNKKIEKKFFDKKNKAIAIIEYNEKELGTKKSLLTNKNLILIKNPKNYGFVRGNNIAMEFALNNLQPGYVLLLNNDTVVEKKFLDELVVVAENKNNVGFVGPKIYFYNYKNKNYSINDNIIQHAGATQNLWNFKPKHIGYGKKDIGQYNEIKKVDYIHGSCILAKTQTILEVGLLDEDYVSYREENDWCMRGHKKGWKSFYTYKSVIWHKGGGSTNKKNIQPLVLYYMTRNRFLFIKKHANNWQMLSFLIYFFIFDFWWTMGVSILYFKHFRLLKCYLKATRRGLRYF